MICEPVVVFFILTCWWPVYSYAPLCYFHSSIQVTEMVVTSVTVVESIVGSVLAYQVSFDHYAS